ncbi:187-kDa microtubule-associated protein AIR9-like [Carica papaya]|uniref:187-kDa microtubule-associated protein AIR9-like n=1 Tax=Carica papaya TaxID=3649 RepID=UPI000B8CCB98|nr:187-kDa microtubule-associated protein AIR9-like [Carica papaya]
MEDSVAQSTEGFVEKPQNLEKQSSGNAADGTKKGTESAKTGVTEASLLLAPAASIIKKTESTGGVTLSSSLTKATVSSSLRNSKSISVTRRNSTGGASEKSSTSTTRSGSNISTTSGKKTTIRSVVEPVRRSAPELRRSSLPSVATKPTSKASLSETRKSVPVSSANRNLTTSTGSSINKSETVKKSSIRPTLSVSSSSKKVTTLSPDSSSSSSTRKTVSKISSPSARSPSFSGGLRAGALSSSLDRSSNLSGRRKPTTPESRDSRLIVLPQVEMKAGDDVRLDLRGHRIRSLNANGLNLSSNLEFVYLRDNLLATLEGVEILKRVKVDFFGIVHKLT